MKALPRITLFHCRVASAGNTSGPDAAHPANGKFSAIYSPCAVRKVTNPPSRTVYRGLRGRILICVLVLAGALPAYAQDGPDANLDAGSSVAAEESLRGLVVDRTVTFFGRDFYGYFVDVWREQAGAAEINLVVHERPDPRFGSEVSIEFDRNIEFRAFISPTRSRTRALAESAAMGLAQKLSGLLQKRRGADGPDLAADEM